MNFHHSDSKLRITERAHGPIGILECNGRIVYGCEAAEFVEHSRRALAKYDALLVCLRATTHLDARGLGALVDVHRTAVARNRAVVFASPAPQVLELLCLTNLHTVLDLHLFEEDAWQSLGERVA